MTKGKDILKTDEITIRAAEINDIPEIQRLYKQLDSHHAAIIPKFFLPVEGNARKDDIIADWINRKDAAYLVAEKKGKITGFLNLQKTRHPQLPVFRPHEFAMIENLIVDKSHRGRKIGMMLLDKAMEWSRMQGVKQIQVMAWNDNIDAMRFYLKRGFSPLLTRMGINIE